MKIFVTFGQSHIHIYDGERFDKDCVGVIEAPSENEARKFLFNIFGPKWCFTHPEEHWKKMDNPMKYFPDGYKHIPYTEGKDDD